MPRGVTLIELLNDYRLEAGLSSNVAHNKGVRDAQAHKLQRVQRRLWECHDWGHLEEYQDIAVNAGERFPALPDNISTDRIKLVEARDQGLWVGLKHGINSIQYASCDSDMDARSDPPERYELRGERLEIWPIPNRDANIKTLEGYIRIHGVRDLKPLKSDSDRCDLDSDLIVLHAVLEDMTDKHSAAAQILGQKIRRLESALTSQASKIKQFRLGARLLRGGRWSRQMRAPGR
ncbi:hypothetical protein [Polycladidibacter hongkongensis]|uniref:hypothetical protein n=1 Tax=Polycladidibacter hongkongensis TaxID=1647556 RepID=UPI00082C7097|nr:hypothetical protein [Pseudovibrio hongkongensis]